MVKSVCFHLTLFLGSSPLRLTDSSFPIHYNVAVAVADAAVTVFASHHVLVCAMCVALHETNISKFIMDF